MEEKNIKISKFMKLTHNQYHLNILDRHNVYPSDELEYHSNWNWLMPVIKKCFSAKDNDKMLELTNNFDFWELDKMYDAVIKYIDWYTAQ
jgi:hypothetical protein